MNEITSNLKRDFDGLLNFLREDLSKIRTGRASPAVVEDLPVEAYGGRMLLKELAAIRIPEPQQLLIEPWDKSVLEDLVRALLLADLGAQPVVEKTSLRIIFPPLTSERRAALMVEVGRKVETAKNQLRYLRQAAREAAEKLEAAQGKDFVFDLKKEIDDAVDRMGESLEELKQKKEQEIAS